MQQLSPQRWTTLEEIRLKGLRLVLEVADHNPTHPILLYSRQGTAWAATVSKHVDMRLGKGSLLGGKDVLAVWRRPWRNPTKTPDASRASGSLRNVLLGSLLVAR